MYHGLCGDCHECPRGGPCEAKEVPEAKMMDDEYTWFIMEENCKDAESEERAGEIDDLCRRMQLSCQISMSFTDAEVAELEEGIQMAMQED